MSVCVFEARIKLRNDFFFFFFHAIFHFQVFFYWLWIKLAILVLHARTKIGNSIRNKKRKTRQVVGAKRQQLGLFNLMSNGAYKKCHELFLKFCSVPCPTPSSQFFTQSIPFSARGKNGKEDRGPSLRCCW